jgi:hypothetical protein
LNGFAVNFALLLGQLVQVEASTDYLLIDGRSYAIGIRDPMHNVYLPLAGRGCFESLPLDSEWIAVRRQYNSTSVQRFQIRRERVTDVLNRLRCASSLSLRVFSQERFTIPAEWNLE